MVDLHTSERLSVRNILCLTDFSPSSDSALQCAKSLGRAHNGKIHVLHVLCPDIFTSLTPDSPAAALDLQEQWAFKEMERVEKQLAGSRHETLVVRANDLWTGVEPQLQECQIDVIVVATHGQSGLAKLVMGSGAEQVLRRSPVPVIVVGPALRQGSEQRHFSRIVFPSDLTPQSLSAAPIAVSLAQENEAQLILLHVIPRDRLFKRAQRNTLSVAEAMHRLQEMVPAERELGRRPETIIEYGEPAARIVETAKDKAADLIVLGVRTGSALFTATHFENTAHEVIAGSHCPVLTVRTNCA